MSRPPFYPLCRRADRGTILVLVLMIALGLVALALYFANSMTLEYRAAGNAAAGMAAGQACAGARRYLLTMLGTLEKPGRMPETDDYLAEDVPVGDDAHFWLIGRDANAQQATDQPVFGLIDEASKLNLNIATTDTLQMLPQVLPTITTEMVTAILDWHNPNGGVTDTYYPQRNPSYNPKVGAFETITELRLVKGFEASVLDGEDANHNGALDPNENDGNATPPGDNQDGRLDPGILEYVTVCSREPNKRADGTSRINVTNQNSTVRQTLWSFLGTTLDPKRAQDVQTALTGAPPVRSVLEFYKLSGLKADEFAKVEDGLSASNDAFISGLVNVNTAPEKVLECLPGIGTEHAAELIAARQGKAAEALESIAWVGDLLDPTAARQAGPLLTTRSYQFTADVVALGANGRGMRRELLTIDTADGTPKLIYRRDLGRLGWPLGAAMRNELRQSMPKN